MHLRSITLKGFKSFPDRTRLDFGPGVSVVVGDLRDADAVIVSENVADTLVVGATPVAPPAGDHAIPTTTPSCTG